MSLKSFPFILLLVICLLNNVLSDGPDTVWTKAIGTEAPEYCNYLEVLDNGFLVTGYGFSEKNNSWDGYLIRTDFNGDTLWTKKYGGRKDDKIYGSQRIEGKGFFAIGTTESFGNGYENIWLLKINDKGDTIWTKTFGNNSTAEGESIVSTEDGNYMIAGNLVSNIDHKRDIWVIKIDENGDSLFSRVYSKPDEQEVQKIISLRDGSFILAGYSGVYVGIGHIYGFLMKVDANGDTLWYKEYNITGSDRFYSVKQTQDMGFIVVGKSFYKLLLMKTDSLGNMEWSKKFSGEAGYSVVETNKGEFIAVGTINISGGMFYDFFIIKVDKYGKILWYKYLGGDKYDSARSIDLLLDNSLIVAGTTASFGSGNEDIWLVKMKSDVTSLEDREKRKMPNLFNLENYPNPFNSETKIKFYLSSNTDIKVSVHNLLGQQVSVLFAGKLAAGFHTFIFNASGLNSGIYFYTVSTKEYSITKKLVYIK